MELQGIGGLPMKELDGARPNLLIPESMIGRERRLALMSNGLTVLPEKGQGRNSSPSKIRYIKHISCNGTAAFSFPFACFRFDHTRDNASIERPRYISSRNSLNLRYYVRRESKKWVWVDGFDIRDYYCCCCFRSSRSVSFVRLVL